MHLDLTDEETAALTQELHDLVESDKYPFPPRIRTLRTILETGAGSPALAATEGVSAAALYSRTATARLKMTTHKAELTQ